MNIAIAILGLLALAQAAPQPRGLPEWSPRIVGGYEVKPGDLPFQISLQFNGSHVCGGSIYNDQWIVTAAHCATLSGRPQDFTVRAGIHNIRDPDESSQLRTVVLSIVNRNEGPGLSSDLAIMKLDSPLVLARGSNASAIPLAKAGRQVSGDLTVSGWGLLVTNGTIIPSKLRAVTVPFVDDAECSKAYPGLIEDFMICAGDVTGGKGNCKGDSGGPLTAVINGETTLVGIVSWSRGCADPEYYGVYCEVSYFEEWIRSNIAANS